MLFASAFGRLRRHTDVVDERARSRDDLDASRRAVMLAHRLALLDIGAQHFRRYGSHYNPNEPRAPAGHPDGGQWTHDGSRAGVQLAAGERGGGSGWAFTIGALLKLGLELIKEHRKEEILRDLFGDVGTVAWTRIDGNDIFGYNSRSSKFTSEDRANAEDMLRRLSSKDPELARRAELGQMPTNAFFHAETTVLLRAAHKYGGTLAGRTLHVIVDRLMCPSCPEILPRVGLEIGNPTVTFTDHRGRTRTMRDGQWLE
jgi:hypothetical protein